ncbi:MAG: coproporphyrinogen dehydrogenase HemZ [Bacillota bacterium]|nr:coproporphyrinogen dehydrogenase HemZ [Bacillota bacterium]
MNIYIENHEFHYELENLTRIFLPNDKITVHKNAVEFEKPFIKAIRTIGNKNSELIVEVYFDDFDKSEKIIITNNIPDYENECERQFAVMIFKLLQEYTGVNPPWGILTGVRPIKLFRNLKNQIGTEETERYFKEKLLVSDKKTALSKETEKNESKIIELSKKDSFSLYVSVPFCPSRCAYCSFVSQSVEKTKHLMEPYTDLLCKEIAKTAGIATKVNLKLESVYIGGGTPTALTPTQLNKIIKAISKDFNLSDCREFTVEAGRPDTVNDEMLIMLHENGIDRISINPQTLNDTVLENIGRRHTARQSIEAFELARKHGFTHVNMDLIVGLPGDSFESFQNTLNQICNLEPESITIHTLAKKRSAELTASKLEILRKDSQTADEMMAFAQDKLKNMYIPYYLYRQSRMVGNLENIGFSKPGFESFYNIFVMDETHTILACGAGGVTKLKEFGTSRLERIFNFKYPYEYISRFDEIQNRKSGIMDFYKNIM